MQTQLNQLQQFINKFDDYIQQTSSSDIPAPIRELRSNLLLEETTETIEAMRQGDINQIAKELADLQYVLLGTVFAYGLQDQFTQVFTAVHQSNMSKDPNPAGGKAIKGKNYKVASITI